ncbi:hypothetical protein PODOV006v2_p0017 [Vibrio phage 15E36.1]|uniref:Uncharacterized protein n=1 Tax=Vibrio phage 15E36.1 TaxID=2859290 RepID=A0AAE8C4S6_9CAUD|nr:hypothetical protein PODOV006v2_p0017 [Vibrio phage 15E36.1]
MRNIQKMGNSHQVPEDEYVPRKHRSRKQKRGEVRELKRSWDINDDKQAFGKHSLRR